MKSKELFPPIFSRHAAAYHQRMETIMSRGGARGRLRAIELLEARPGMLVLDLACGPGTLTLRLAAQVEPGGEVVGVDLAAGMIGLARAAGIPNARFEVMDIEQLEFPEGTFDGAACGHGLQFASNLSQALREARRVLRPGARLAASIPVDGGVDRPWKVMEAVVDRWLPPAPTAADQQATRATLNDRESLRVAALTAGFATSGVELVEEMVRWESAEQLVSRCMSWWDLAARMDGVDEARRQAFRQDALTTMQRDYPGAIETTGRTHVLLATA